MIDAPLLMMSAPGRMLTSNGSAGKDIRTIRADIDRLYDLPADFCPHYEVPAQEGSLRGELTVKASFLWEELTGAKQKRFYGYPEEETGRITDDYTRRFDDMIAVVNNIIHYKGATPAP